MSCHIQNAQDELIAAHRRLLQRTSESGGGDGALRRSGDPARRARSLQTCHRPAAAERGRRKREPDRGGYVPELAARLDNDPNLTDGARRCGRKIAEEAYRRNREGRALTVTVTYLAKALGRCRRTVQRYLRQLEAEGYVAVDVLAGSRTRLCVGIIVRLLEPLFPAHHKERWPTARGNPGATGESLNHRTIAFRQSRGTPIPVRQWALRCMDGVFRSFMKTNPLAGLPPIVTS